MLFYRLRTCAVSLLLAWVCVTAALAEQQKDDSRNVVNYSYAVVFGTGAYTVNDQTAFVFRAPFSYTVREPTPDRPGLKWLLPALVGYYDYGYDKIVEANLPGDAATLGFVPGAEFEYIMTERWRLKPYGQLGIGRDIENKENAGIVVAGITSHYRIPYAGKWRFSLGNSVVYTGSDPDDGSYQSMGILGVGMDMVYPWQLSVLGKDTALANYLIYYSYIDHPGFEQGDQSTESISGEIEWGVALGFDKPLSLFGLEFERIGLGFRYGDDIKGVRLVSDFPF